MSTTVGEKKSGLSLKGKDIMPTTKEQRHITPPVFMMIWWGMAIQLVAFIAGAQLYPYLSPKMILIAAIIGNGIVAVILTLTGDIGIMYGIPYAVYIRAAFGYVGTHIPALIRAGFAIFWFGFQTWFGAFAMNTIVEILTGYSNLNLLIILFGAIQIINMMYGVKAVAVLEQWAAPVLMVVGVLMLVLILKKYNATLGQVMAMPGEGGLSFGFAVVAQMGHFITMALNIPDFTRYLVTEEPEKKTWLQANFGSFWSQTVGLVGALGLFTFIGIVTGVLTGNWNPIEVLIDLLGPGNPLLLVVCLLFILFATWSTNTAANLVPPTYIIINVCPHKINLKVAAIIAGVVGLLMRPWIFANNVPTILTVSSALLGPVAGIMICDYYLLRKRRLNLVDLYTPGGQYEYFHNVNPAAILAYIPGAIMALIWPDYGFVLALGVSIVLYYPLMKYWIAKKYPQPEILDPNYPINNAVDISTDF